MGTEAVVGGGMEISDGGWVCRGHLTLPSYKHITHLQSHHRPHHQLSTTSTSLYVEHNSLASVDEVFYCYFPASSTIKNVLFGLLVVGGGGNHKKVIIKCSQYHIAFTHGNNRRIIVSNIPADICSFITVN